jgi:hypothetical protein
MKGMDLEEPGEGEEEATEEGEVAETPAAEGGAEE